MKRTNGIILVIGITCVIFGIWAACVVIKDFCILDNLGIHMRMGKSAQDLGTTLAGTAGVLFTLGGVAFFTVSLLQTNIEMRQTRDLISNQLAQSTYFNLVKHHKDLYNLRPTNESEITLLKERLDEYVRCVSMGRFGKFSQLSNYPGTLYESIGKLKIIGDSLINVANYIYDNLKNDQFYHRTFYLSLSEQEKYYFGFVLRNELNPVAKLDYSFNYAQLYNAESKFINDVESPYFPFVANYGIRSKTLFVCLGASIEEHKEFIERDTEIMLVGLEHPDLKLSRINYSGDYQNIGIDPRRISIGHGTITPTSQIINLYEVIKVAVWPQLNATHIFHVGIDFIFTFQNREFIVSCPLLIEVAPTEKLPVEITAICDKYPGKKIYCLHIVELP